MNDVDKMEEALIAFEAIMKIAEPGQEIYHSQAIDKLCDIYNIARDLVATLSD